MISFSSLCILLSLHHLNQFPYTPHPISFRFLPHHLLVLPPSLRVYFFNLYHIATLNIITLPLLFLCLFLIQISLLHTASAPSLFPSPLFSTCPFFLLFFFFYIFIFSFTIFFFDIYFFSSTIFFFCFPIFFTIFFFFSYEGLRADPLSGPCWNGLGLCLSQRICYNSNSSILGSSSCTDSNFAAAQACFVRATQIDANAPAFANLGMCITTLILSYLT